MMIYSFVNTMTERSVSIMSTNNETTQPQQSHLYKQEHIKGTGTGDYECIRCGHVTSNKDLDTTKSEPKDDKENHMSDY
jgi:hypothetical protein